MVTWSWQTMSTYGSSMLCPRNRYDYYVSINDSNASFKTISRALMRLDFIIVIAKTVQTVKDSTKSPKRHARNYQL